MNSRIKYALVTGASSGIGWHISSELARRGYSIVAVSNQAKQLSELKVYLEAAFIVNVVTIDMDLIKQDSAYLIYNYCNDNNLEIEVLVNDAGIFFFGEIAKTDFDRISAMMALHIMTPVNLCRLFGTQMASKRKGFILNVSSITAVMPYPGISPYGPTKTFIRHFTRAFRTEMKLDNVSVTCLMPGATDTSLYDSAGINTRLLKALGIMKSPEKVASAGVRALLTGRALCIPGFFNKIIVFLIPLIPGGIIEIIARKSDVIRQKK